MFDRLGLRESRFAGICEVRIQRRLRPVIIRAHRAAAHDGAEPRPPPSYARGDSLSAGSGGSAAGNAA